MLLPCNREGLNFGAISRLLSSALSDPKERVKAVALDGMAVMAK